MLRVGKISTISSVIAFSCFITVGYAGVVLADEQKTGVEPTVEAVTEDDDNDPFEVSDVDTMIKHLKENAG